MLIANLVFEKSRALVHVGVAYKLCKMIPIVTLPLAESKECCQKPGRLGFVLRFSQNRTVLYRWPQESLRYSCNILRVTGAGGFD